MSTLTPTQEERRWGEFLSRAERVVRRGGAPGRCARILSTLGKISRGPGRPHGGIGRPPVTPPFYLYVERRGGVTPLTRRMASGSSPWNRERDPEAGIPPGRPDGWTCVALFHAKREAGLGKERLAQPRVRLPTAGLVGSSRNCVISTDPSGKTAVTFNSPPRA
jgi:hypothetical protein